ncbi:SusC/RagA family TonB-linked outer membrane protein [Niabella ginsengisoli]|uniref:TonB-dependent receptor n=1 Tax=Niabella ginsengisoli TaxID=522298 RepID=A0ABS9SGF9_9BACT|nr:TonB-dependent receptor [Niabella ginsengisoli]MCH5597440.1 TonB-dependent receptor [Niabella ginsengisoli]
MDGEDLRFGGRNLSNNLQGQVSGIISFQRSGEPGYDNATFWIRGVSTYNGVQNPLILVDGVPRTFNDIDPNEIETFSVLKDAAATAVFGAEGANGVILVTTKRGKSQKTRITYRGEASTLTPFRMPEFVGAPEFMELYNETRRNEGLTDFFTQGRIDSTRQQLDPDLYPDVNWLGALIKNRTSNTRHNLSFRGGTENARYFVSTAYYSESGIFQNNSLSQYSSNINLKRYNLRSNVDLNVTNTTLLRIDLSGQYLTTNYPGSGTDDIFNVSSFAPPYLYPMFYSDGKSASHPVPSANRSNPYNLLNNSGYTNEYRTALQSYIGLEQKLDAFTKGLRAKVGVSYDFSGTFTARTGKSVSTYFATGRDPATGAIVYNKTANGTGELTDGGTSFSTNRNIYMEGSINYARLFSNKHDVTAMGLVYRKESVLQQAGISLVTRLPYRKMAYVGRFTYAYDRRYSAEINVGITGSEQFVKGNRYGTFPAAGLAWIVSNEPYYPQQLKDVLSNFKLRASVGLTGNDATGAARFLYRGGFISGTGFSLGYNSGGPLGTFGGYVEDKFAAPGLSWESELKQNYGVDLGFFKNKINVTVDYFDNLRSDILLQRATVSEVAGFRQMPWQNYGKVSNKGFDASITANHQVGDHNFGARVNYTFARNKTLERDEVPQLYPYMNETGVSLNTPYIYQADRLFTQDDFTITTDGNGIQQYELKPSIASQQFFGPDAMLRPGDIKYVDLNSDGIIDQFDQSRHLSKPTTPEVVYGFGASYGYKGFSINVFFAGVANTQAVLGSSVPQGFFPFRFNVDETGVRTIARDRWTEANPSQDVLFPRLRTGTNTNNETASTWWLRDMSFLRLKNVELGYELPQTILERISMSNARVYLMGFNLVTWDKLKIWDPEQGAGNSGMTYPQSRTFTLEWNSHLNKFSVID